MITDNPQCVLTIFMRVLVTIHNVKINVYTVVMCRKNKPFEFHGTYLKWTFFKSNSIPCGVWPIQNWTQACYIERDKCGPKHRDFSLSHVLKTLAWLSNVTVHHPIHYITMHCNPLQHITMHYMHKHSTQTCLTMARGAHEPTSPQHLSWGQEIAPELVFSPVLTDFLQGFKEVFTVDICLEEQAGSGLGPWLIGNQRHGLLSIFLCSYRTRVMWYGVSSQLLGSENNIKRVGSLRQYDSWTAMVLIKKIGTRALYHDVM